MRTPGNPRHRSRGALVAGSAGACASALLLSVPAVAATGGGHGSAAQPRAAAGHSTDPGVTHPNADSMGSQVRRHMPAPPRASAHTVPPMAANQVPGLDVSSHQGKVDWAHVKAAGAKFSYTKATEGTGYTNPYFVGQYDGPRKQGILRGAYHFALPDQSSGKAQADYFVNHGGGWRADGMTLPGALDIEWNPYGDACYGMSQDEMVAWIRSFTNEYQARTGRWPVIYTARAWWQQCTGGHGDFSATSPLWVANYDTSPGKLPHAWNYQTIWQFANSGTFPGDQDRFNGTLAQLKALATG